MEPFILCGKYRVLKVLGNHDDTIVYFAQHVLLLNYCMIKKINKEEPDFLVRFREVQVLMALKHPGIPQILDVFENEKAVYFAEEYMEGTTLQQVCESDILSEQTIISYGIQLCNLIYYLHTADPPVLHLDIKPSNIIVHNGKLALIDFSAAQYLQSSQKVHYGTRFFAAPEQYQASEVSMQTDIYAVGAVLYYMMVHVQSPCNERLKKVTSRCLSQEKENRYNSIQEVGQLLLELREDKLLARKGLFTIGVAGTQHRIGTTHFALQMASYLGKQQKKCLYAECNHTHAARELIQKEGELAKEHDLYECHGIKILPESENPDLFFSVLKSYEVMVMDFGVLTKENISEFCKADQQFLLYGGKAWERSLRAYDTMLEPDRNHFCILGNFQTANEFYKSSEGFGMSDRERLPYEPDCFAFSKQSLTWKLFQRLIK